MKRLAPLLTVLLLLSAPAPVQAQEWDASGSIIRDYEEAAGEWSQALLGPAREFFALLAGLELAIFSLYATFKPEDMRVTLGRYALKLSFLAFLLSLMVNFNFWFPPIIEGFMDAAQIATGIPALQPGEISYRGYQLHREIASSYDMSLFSMDFGAISAFIGSYIVLIAFCFIALLVTVALAEAIVILSTGVFFLSFSAFRATVGITEGYLKYVVEVGVRLFLLHLLVGLGTSLAFGWMALIQNAADFDPAPVVIVALGSTIFAAIVFKISYKMSAVVSEGLRLNLRGAVTQ